jgi:hypothetical protein
MANPSTATPNAASAQTAVQATQVNRELLALFAAGAEAGLQTSFELQNAGLASAQALFDRYADIGKTAFGRYAELNRQAQETGTRILQTTLNARD